MCTTERQLKRRILTLDETCKRVGCSKSTLRRMELEGLFPKRVRRGRKGVGHFEDEVEVHLEELERIEIRGN